MGQPRASSDRRLTGEDLRRPTGDEWRDFCRSFMRVFNEPYDDDGAEAWRPVLPTDRCWTAADDFGHVATSGSLPFRMSVPGGDTVACAAITVVTVRSDHRRRGLMRAMMERLHGDAKAAGEPVAALYASEAAIYGRFGYGAAVPRQRIEVRARDLADLPGTDGSRVRLVSREEYLELAPKVTAAIAGQRGGMLTMSAASWSAETRDDDPKRPDWFAAVEDRGVVRYRTKDGPWNDRVPDARLDVVELLGSDPQAQADLWAHVGVVDLVTEVAARRRPVDDPLRWLVADEARVRDRSDMPLFVRLLDVPVAMTARTWDVSDRLVFDVRDDTLPDNAGRWVLEATPSGSTFERTTGSADVVLDVRELASMWLGGVAPSTLADAGRLDVVDPAVVSRLRRLFAVDHQPWTSVDF